jgi:hypothetical protein
MVFSIAVHTTLFVQVYTADFTGDLTSVYRCRGLKSRPTLAIFILIILSFIGATIYWATWVAGLVIQIRWTFVKNYGMDLSEKMALTDAAMAKPGLVEFLVEPFLVL